MTRFLVMTCLSLLAFACDTTIAAKDYNQKCSVDADCVLVGEGDLCAPCGGGCGSQAINTADKARYDRDATAIRNACVRLPGPPVACAAIACQEPEAFCNAGTCASRPVQRRP